MSENWLLGTTNYKAENMSENETTTAVKKKSFPVSPFTVECDDPTNSDVLIQVLGTKLRSAIKPVKEILDWENGERVTRPVNARMIDGLPRDLPGMRLYVNPSEGTWKITDPLRDNQDVLDKVQRAIKASGRTIRNLRGVSTKTGELGVDEMKTLMKEIHCMIKAGHVRVIKGREPEMEDIEKMPGDFLLNWSNRGDWAQPRYAKDLDEFKRSLNRLG